MDRSLYLAVEEAAQSLDDSIRLRDAVIQLTDNEPAVSVLLAALVDEAITAELKWREIEQMPEYRQRYKCRDDCRADFSLRRIQTLNTERTTKHTTA